MTDRTLPVDLLREIDEACDRFESQWAEAADGHPGPLCEEFAAELPEAARDDALRELHAIERQYRAKRGEADSAWAADRPAIAELQVRSRNESETIAAPTGGSMPSATGGLRVVCPHCGAAISAAVDSPLDEISCQACGSTFGLIDKPDRPAAGAVRVGRFLLRERLGMGAFGAVWRARDPELDRDVALKMPRRGQLLPHEAEMFFREARAAAQLAHPGIVSIYEVGRDDGPDGAGSIYLVSELVDGEPLSDRLKAWRPSPREAAGLLADIADALDFAHSRGVIHRDLKPSNIMLDRFASGGETARVGLSEIGRPRLMDFGLAKRDAGEVTMTVEGQVLGTPAYMSPEQASGQIRWVDRRTDVYSLGVVMFRLLTGELPYRGTAQSQIQQRQTDDAPSPRRLDDSVPPDLATVCLKCLERDIPARYDSAGDVAAELRRYLDGEPVLARPISAWGRAARWARRRPASATALGLAAFLAVAGPVAAIVIATQSNRIIEGLKQAQIQNERNVAASSALAARKDAETLEAIASLASVKLSKTTRDVIEASLDEHGDAWRERVMRGDPATLVGARERVALARLLLAVGRIDQASELLDGLQPEQSPIDALAASLRGLEDIQRTPAEDKSELAEVLKRRAEIEELLSADTVDLAAVAETLLVPVTDNDAPE